MKSVVAVVIVVVVVIAVIYLGQYDKKTERQKNNMTEKQKDIKTEGQKDTETERQKDIKTEGQKNAKTEKQKNVNTLSLTSPVFKNNEMMPALYTCDGEDISPPLEISGAPENAKSLVLIMDDPDATGGQTWDHWVVFNLQPTTVNIQQGEEPAGVPGKNSWGRTGYGGPCPPSAGRSEPVARRSPPSGTHRYFFKLYALDTILDLAPGATKKEAERAMEGRILDKTELIGLYKRK